MANRSRFGLRIRWTAPLGLLGGVALFAGVVAWQGWELVVTAMVRIGWGVLWLPVVYAPALVLAGLSWRALFERSARPGRLWAIGATWIGMAFNWLLPSGQVGGDLVKAHLHAGRFDAGGTAVASVVVDKTLQLVTLIAFALLGLGLLVAVHGSATLGSLALAGAALLGLATAGFVVAQRRGMFRGGVRWIERLFPASAQWEWSARAEQVDAAIRAMYADRSRLLRALALRTGFRAVIPLEVLTLLWLVGEPVSIVTALILEGLGQAVRAGAFVIPGGFGAQEAAFVVLGMAVGLPGESALAIALCKRARELLLGLPALGGWQWTQGRALIRRRRGSVGDRQ